MCVGVESENIEIKKQKTFHVSLHVEWMKRFDKFRFHKLGEIRDTNMRQWSWLFVMWKFFVLLLHNSGTMNLDHTFTYPQSQLSDEKCLSHRKIFSHRRQKRRKKFSVTFRMMWRLYTSSAVVFIWYLPSEQTPQQLKRMKLYSNLMESFVWHFVCHKSNSKVLRKFN